MRARRRRQVKMRIETRNTMNLVKRSLRVRGKRLKLRLGQKPVAQLNSPQVVEDHGAPSRMKERP